MRYIVIILTSILLVFNASESSAQCTPDLNLTVPGFYPNDTLLPCIEKGVAYDTVIQFLNFDSVDAGLFDPQFSGNTVVIDSIEIKNILGMPSGITFQCNPPTCVFPGGTYGCISLNGTTNDKIGDYPLTIEAQIAVTTPNGGHISVPGNASAIGYKFKFHIINPGKACPCYAPDVDFDFEIVEHTVTFTNTSTDYDSVLWVFGDGQQMVGGDTVVHEYPTDVSNVYPMRLIVSNGCGKDTLNQGVVIISTGIEKHQSNIATIYPNPSAGKYNFQFDAINQYNIIVTDVSGKIIYADIIDNHVSNNYVLNLTDYNNGIYLVKLFNDQKFQTQKLIISK